MIMRLHSLGESLNVPSTVHFKVFIGTGQDRIYIARALGTIGSKKWNHETQKFSPHFLATRKYYTKNRFSLQAQGSSSLVPYGKSGPGDEFFGTVWGFQTP